MDAAVKEAGLMFMCEMGLDPGIDHMTANHIIHSIQRVAGSITSFKSYCGGLVAPECDDNPWHYKFSWNPRNIVTAGYGGGKYLQQGKEVDVPYEKMFENNKKIKVDGLGALAYYPNRDSLRYLDLYEVPDIKTFMRATLRYPSFCKGWYALVQLGLTTDKDTFDTKGYTYASWVKEKTGYKNDITLNEHLANKLGIAGDDQVMTMLQWLGIFDEIPIKPQITTSADILLTILLDKWKMGFTERDMIVMQHEVEYVHKNRKTKLTSTMVLEGVDRDHSAMAKTVGLPMGILAKLMLTKKVKPPHGVLIPAMPSIYRPILTELAHHGITFTDEVE